MWKSMWPVFLETWGWKGNCRGGGKGGKGGRETCGPFSDDFDYCLLTTGTGGYYRKKDCGKK